MAHAFLILESKQMFLGNEEKVYILDKVEANPTQFGGHSAWATEWCVESELPIKIALTNTWQSCAASLTRSYLYFPFPIGNGRDIATSQARPMSVITNPFCSSGMHFPNGSFATFGGNGAIGPGGAEGSVVGPTGTG